MLADELTDQSLRDLKVPLMSIQSKQEVWSRKEWIAWEVLKMLNKLLLERLLDTFEEKEKEIGMAKEDVLLPIPEPSIEMPKLIANNKISESWLPVLSAENYALLMNHIDVSEAESEILILEFTDLECPFCQRHHNNGTLQNISEKYPKVNHTTLAYPLSFHPHAMPAAVAMNCVHKHAWYEEAKTFKDTLIQKWLSSSDQIGESITALWLEWSVQTRVMTCVDLSETKLAVDQQMKLWSRMWVTWTPGNILLHMPTRQYTKISWAVPESAFDRPIKAMLDGDFESMSVPLSPPPRPNNPPVPLQNLTQIDYDDFLEWAYIQGNTQAKVSIIEFSDVQCPFCQRHTNNGTLDQVHEKYGDDVNIIYAHFPLSFHQNAQMAGEALECAGDVGWDDMFFAFKEAYYSAGGDSNIDIALEAAEEVWLDIDTLELCIEKWTFSQKVKDQMAFGQWLWVTGTPGNVVINNETLETIKISWAVSATAFDSPVEDFLWEEGEGADEENLYYPFDDPRWTVDWDVFDLSVSEVWQDYIDMSISKAYFNGKENKKYIIYYSEKSLASQKLSLIKDQVVIGENIDGSDMVKIKLSNSLKPLTKYYIVVTPIKNDNDGWYIESFSLITEEVIVTTLP